MTPEERFEQLAAEVSGPLHRYVARRVAPEDVDDVLADVTLVLWRRLDEVPMPSAAGALPWCYGVARRVVANHRRGALRRLHLLERVRREPVPPAGDEEFPEVHVALARLGDLDREVVRLWAWEQLEPREIATVLGTTPNAVSIRLHRARRRLAGLLRKDGVPAGHEPPDEGSDR